MQVEQWLWQSFRYQRSAIRIQTQAKFYTKYDLQLTVEKTKLTKKEAGSGAFKKCVIYSQCDGTTSATLRPTQNPITFLANQIRRKLSSYDALTKSPICLKTVFVHLNIISIWVRQFIETNCEAPPPLPCVLYLCSFRRQFYSFINKIIEHCLNIMFRLYFYLIQNKFYF